jgi:hypothetical protein
VTKARDEWLPKLREVFDGRPVRWAKPVGDFDGRERTLDVFYADAFDQIGLLKRFQTARAKLEEAVGGPVIVIFHTTRETERLYSDVVAATARVCEWCDPHFRARREGRSAGDHTRCDDFECGCHCQDRTKVN